MQEELLMEEEEEIRRIRECNQKKDMHDLNRKRISQDELDKIFCEF
ncbi:MAG: hypothetical protein KKF89_06410 [Nanoarchaeota archaeon]|nr:hypothetical protein [Nanoarchaeota archaeon]MBU1855331.1 hypothetical protein [Nanoarchaeota archaeon]